MATRTRQRIDINAANAEEIEKACGIDGVLAQRIVAYRDEHRPFKDRADLDAVTGFGDVRTEEVLSVVDLPRRSGGSKRAAPRGRATREPAGQRSHAASGTRGTHTSSRQSSTSGSKSSASSTGGRRSRSADPVTDHD